MPEQTQMIRFRFTALVCIAAHGAGNKINNKNSKLIIIIINDPHSTTV